jgi:hypothetical protein
MSIDCSPRTATLREGFERILDVFPIEPFIIFVNGEELKMSVVDAVLISPKIHQQLRCSPCNHSFGIQDERLTAKDIFRFVEFVHSDFWHDFSKEEQSSFISICSILGNRCLSLILMNRLQEMNKGLKDEKDFFLNEIDARYCALNFYSYSIDLLKLLDKSVFHEILSSPSLTLENEDGLLKLLINLGSDYFEFWSYIEVSCLSVDGIQQFVEKLSFEDLTENIWIKIGDRLRGTTELNPKRYRSASGFESKILKVFPDLLKDFVMKEWTLLYRGSRDGFGSGDFHGKCENRGNTMTLIETTKGFIFGGFTPIPWDSSSGHKSDNSQMSFLFTLKNSRNSEPRKFRLASAANAIYCHSSYGPTFGNGHDLYVSNGCDGNNSSYTNLGNGYVNDTGFEGKVALIGEYNFTVKEIEVFMISP